VSHSADTNTRR